jgi:hypothetical protein
MTNWPLTPVVAHSATYTLSCALLGEPEENLSVYLVPWPNGIHYTAPLPAIHYPLHLFVPTEWKNQWYFEMCCLQFIILLPSVSLVFSKCFLLIIRSWTWIFQEVTILTYCLRSWSFLYIHYCFSIMKVQNQYEWIWHWIMSHYIMCHSLKTSHYQTNVNMVRALTLRAQLTSLIKVTQHALDDDTLFSTH